MALHLTLPREQMQLPDDRQRVRSRRRHAQKREHLLDDDDHPDAAHEPGDDRVGDVADVGADPAEPQGDLQQTREEKDSHQPGKVHRAGRKGVRRHHPSDDQGHRSRRAADLHRRASQQGRDDADGDGSVKSRRWTQPRGDAEGERERECHHACGDPAEEIAAQGTP